MKNLKLTSASALAFVMTSGLVTTALAQEAQGQVGMALPGAAPAAAYAGQSDHDRMVGTLAVGYLGRQSIIVGGVPDAQANPMFAPVVGVRYWLDEMIGIDAGLGFVHNSGEINDADLASRTAFILHGGVPLSLADEGHFSFQIVPELNVGFGSSSADTVDGSGFLLTIGARAGSEIHFGFIGIPQLSLQASVGVAFETNSWKSDPDGAPSVSSSLMRIGTTLQDNPWNIFTSNVAAFYYF